MSCESKEPDPRKQWAAEPSDSVLQMLANASLISSDSMASTDQTITGSTAKSMQQQHTCTKGLEAKICNQSVSVISLLV